MEQPKKFRMIDAMLAIICVVFVAEAAAPVAAIGNSQFFWWIFLIIAFLLPYGLVSSELGTTYDSEGGIYDWIHRAFGGRWGTRVAWYYWINFPLWMASLAIMAPELIGMIFGFEVSLIMSIILQLAFVWIIVLISFKPVSDNAWILNVCAVVKVFLAATVGVLGIYGLVTNGPATAYTAASFMPSLDIDSLALISVILFNMVGFEVVCTFAPSMKNPGKEIPKAIVIGGVVIAGLYLFSSFGIGAALPVDELNASSGLVDSIAILSGSPEGWFVILCAALFLVSLVGNMLSWSLGVNNTARFAARNGHMPKIFVKSNAKDDMPTGPALMNGIVATVAVLIGSLIGELAPGASDVFWTIFALNLVMLLISYIILFPAFLKLRKSDPDAVRPFKVKGSPGFLKFICIVPMVILVVSLIFTAVPFDLSTETLIAVLPITIGAVICILIGELIIKVKKIQK